MQEKGLEPSRHCCHRHLKPARLPIPPFLHELTKVIIPLFFVIVNYKLKVFFEKLKQFMVDIRGMIWYYIIAVGSNRLFAEVSELADEQD